MQATTRLHPLLAAAAISLIVLSGVGVAAMTGLMSPSKGQEPTLELPKEMVKPLEPVISHAPAPKPKPKKTAVNRAVEPIPPVAQAAPAVEAPKPQPLPGQLAIVESVREVSDPGDANGVGAVAGGVVGGVLGNKLGKGKKLLTVLGAAGGAVAGHQIEKRARSEKRWEIAVRLDDGSQRTLSSEVQPAWRPGERVRLVDDKLQPA
jgi:outer membrane lipoprotein SlyB